MGAPASQTGLGSAEAPEPCGLGPTGAIPSADPWAELSTKTPDQIGSLIAAMGPLIDLYSKKLEGAQAQYEHDYRFLAELMTEYLRLTHYVARKAAIALESASAGEAGTATTPQSGVVHEHAASEAGDAQ